MQQTSRIQKIRFRLFRTFTWPNNLIDFARFNLIVGWNATGKTTISSLFRRLEQRQALTEGTAEIVIGSRTCDVSTVTAETPLLPQIRVFNRDFVNDNVLTEQLAPIFYLGADSVQKQIDGLKGRLTRIKEQTANATSCPTAARRDLDAFCIQQAQLIKELLSSNGGKNSYNNYNESDYKQCCRALQQAGNRTSYLMTADRKAELIGSKDQSPKAAMQPLMAAVAMQEVFVRFAINRYRMWEEMDHS